MLRRKVDSNLEKQFLIGMIMSKPFLSSVASVLDIELIDSKIFRRVACWCLDYLKEYGEAPQQQIEALYHSWTERSEADEEEVDAIHDFLAHLSDRYKTAGDLNVPFLLDEFGTYLSLKRLSHLKDNLEHSLLSGDTSEALDAVNSFSSVEIGKGAGIDPLNDRGAWRRAFSKDQAPLITYPGDAGRFLNKALTRDALIGIQGPEKRGKTWWCVEMVMRALRSRKKVALFEVGDLSEGQIMLRLGMRLSGAPLWADQCGKVDVPTKIERIEDDQLRREDEEEILRVSVIWKRKKVPHPLSRRMCLRACRKFLRGCGIPRAEPYVMVSVHPNSSINVAGIAAILDRWAHEKDFIPDVVVIDYADILAPEDTRKQARDQVNDTWRALRRLSQESHSLVIVPTQASAEAYDTTTQTMKHFSEDKRKLAHVTGMLGLNQTELEKESGVMRLNWIVLRESAFSTRQCLYVGQCLTLGRAFCCSTL